MTDDVLQSADHRKSPRNPFYLAIGVLGALFVVTAVAYGLMLYQATRPVGGAPHAGHPLFALMDQYGTASLIVEVVLLGILTVAAIRTDNYWVSRNRVATSESPAQDPKTPTPNPSPEDGGGGFRTGSNSEGDTA